ncbi:MAG: efflux RND transporter periplasmic adaptor subunit [Gemmatimonadota bacterium]
MKTNTKWTIAAIGLCAVALGACGRPAAEEAIASTEREPVSTYVVTAETLDASVPVSGTVEARQRAEISTRLMARVTEVAVELGSHVRAGQALIRLGSEDIEASRAKADAAVTVALAAREEAARQAARMDTLLVADAVARIQRDQAHLALAQAESQLAVAEATRSEVETAAGYARIVAPFDGTVVARSVDEGDLASPGVPLLIVEGGAREAVVAMPPEAAAALEVGSVLDVATRGGRTAVGRVRAVAGGADAMTRSVEVRIEVPAEWPAGESVTAFVPAGARAAVTIPADYVVRRGQLTGVQVVAGETLLLRWVRLGRAVGDRVEVLSGLEPGEVIGR